MKRRPQGVDGVSLYKTIWEDERENVKEQECPKKKSRDGLAQKSDRSARPRVTKTGPGGSAIGGEGKSRVLTDKSQRKEGRNKKKGSTSEKIEERNLLETEVNARVRKKLVTSTGRAYLKLVVGGVGSSQYKSRGPISSK